MNTSAPHGFLRSSIGRIAVTGAATLATCLAVTPAAFAADDVAPEAKASEASPAPESSETTTTTTEDAPTEEAAPEDTAPDDAAPDTAVPGTAVPEDPGPEDAGPEDAGVNEGARAGLEAGADQITSELIEENAPEYAPQTFSISAQLDANDYFPPGTSPSGSTFTIVITDENGGTTTDTCSADTADTFNGLITYCSHLVGNGVTKYFDLAAGSSAVITQQDYDSNQYVVADSTTYTIDPLAADPAVALRASADVHDLVFTATGRTPTATPYSLTADSTGGTPVTVDPLADDFILDPNTTIAVVTQPGHGTAEVIERPTAARDGAAVARAEPNGPVLQYTPNEDYDGPDSFTYSLTNTNGTSSTGTVTVDVQGSDVLEPNYGSQKYRIGVQIASGAFVPAGTTTAGSTFTIETTSQDGATTTTTCTTDAPFLNAPDGASICPGNGNPPFPGLPAGFFSFYTAPAGATVTVTQATVDDDALLPAPDPMVIEPCDDNAVDSCPDTNLTFEDKGSILPETTDDAASTDAGEPVDIDVLANDDSDDPRSDLSIDSAPSNGTAEVIGSRDPAPVEEPVDPPTDPIEFSTELLRPPSGPVLAAVAGTGSLAVRYTPDADFTGVDTFAYALANSNGATTGTVRVTVRGGQVVDPTDPTDGAETPDETGTPDGTVSGTGTTKNANGTLPDTGGPAGTLLGLGALLTAAGAGLVARTRRRPKASRLG